MRSIVLEDNRNSRRYWMYTLIISTYCMNKSGFHCALSFRWFFSDPTSIPLSFSPPYYPGSLRIFFFLFSFYPCTPAGLEPVIFRIPLAYWSLFYTTTLRDQLRIASRKRTFISLGSLLPKNLHYNLLIHLFKACFTPHENMRWVSSEFCLFFVALT